MAASPTASRCPPGGAPASTLTASGAYSAWASLCLPCLHSSTSLFAISRVFICFPFGRSDRTERARSPPQFSIGGGRRRHGFHERNSRSYSNARTTVAVNAALSAWLGFRTHAGSSGTMAEGTSGIAQAPHCAAGPFGVSFLLRSNGGRRGENDRVLCRWHLERAGRYRPDPRRRRPPAHQRV